MKKLDKKQKREKPFCYEVKTLAETQNTTEGIREARLFVFSSKKEGQPR